MAERFRQENTDAGFSLIELIVTVIIIAVLATSSILGVSQILRTNVTTSAGKVTAALDQARYENLYRDGNVTLQLIYENEHYYVVTRLEKENPGSPVIEELRREEIGDQKVTVLAVTTGGVTVDVRTTPVTIAFYKSGGALRAVGSMYKAIRIENASKRAQITLVEHTGRCFLDVEQSVE